jgi:hypothetical protein
MREVNQNNCLNVLLELFPDFQPYWEAYLAYWGSDFTLSGVFGAFADYAIDEIKKDNSPQIKRIFYTIELMLCKGDESVKNSVATVFLEYLVNLGSELNFHHFSKYMGKQSVAFCSAWDEFCGVKTEGLEYDPLSFKYDWEEDFEVEVKIKNDTVLIKANKAGLISLAHQLLNLARDEMPIHEELKLDQENSLKDGSNEIIIHKI